MPKSSRILISLLIMLVIGISACNLISDSTQSSTDPEILAEFEAIKLTITQDGIYRIRLADLGWDGKTAEKVTLTNRENTIPYQVEKKDDDEVAIIFYGQASTSPYTPENIYILDQNGNTTQTMEIQKLLDPTDAPVDYVFSSLHIEENLLYTPKVEDDSTWHWNKIVAPQGLSVEFDLPQVADGPGSLRVALWGATTAPTTPDHHVQVSINDEFISEANWDGQIWHILEAEIPTGVLIEEGNMLEIHATGETDARIDIINLDWIEIDYARSANHLDKQTIFRTPVEPVQIGEDERPLSIYEISNPLETSVIDLPSVDEDIFIFQGDPLKQYLGVSPDGYLQPQQILPLVSSPDLRSSTGAKYIAIGHPDLLASLDPLLKAREAQGLSTMAISTEAVYDQFNGGISEPKAIQQFLAFAIDNWENPPEYVLLVGDTSYDYYGYQTSPDDTFLPTFLVPTVFGGETGSDVLFGQINSDPWPDLAVGRVPARTPEQVVTFVDKTLDFEQQIVTADWYQSILAIADGQESSFRKDAEDFINQFSDNYQTELIAPKPGIQGVNQQIATELENGKLLIAYFGHGSINMWGKDSLFTTEDSEDLVNADRLPVVLNFTCMTGLFTHPTEESLAESLLFNAKGGAVAILAPTSPTLPTDQSFLSNAFLEGMQEPTLTRLGQITLYAWRQVPTDSPSAVDVMQTFLLFGDPALQMPVPNHQ
jgi:hypothetical protein